MIYIWVRATTDWDNEDAFLAQVDPDFKPKVELWNQTFNVPFHVFRHEVRQIARQNHSRVENSHCAEWDELPDAALVLPVDDDDWFAPDIGGVLEGEYDTRASGYYWISSFVEVPRNLGHRLYLVRRRIVPRLRPMWICTSNNYAVVKGSETEGLLGSHIRASQWFGGDGAESVKKIEMRLSIQNRTLASKTTLERRGASISRSELIRKFHRYRKLYRRSTNPELAWSRPYLALMADLMDELSIRDRH